MRNQLTVSFLDFQPPVFDCPARNVVYVKGRRAGGTVGAVNRLIELAHQRPASRHLWMDTVHRNIGRYVHRHFLPRLHGTKAKWNDEQHSLRFRSGAYCDFGSMAKPENIEGFAYDFIWLNEAGTVLRDESIYFHTLLPMLTETSSAQLFLIGAPKGPGLFKRMFEWGEDPVKTDWQSFRHPSKVNFLLNKAELERLSEHMPERTYRQEILAEFVDGEGAVFRNVEAIVRAREETHPQPGAYYVAGVDLARYRDYTVIWVGRMDTGAAVYCERLHNMPWRSQAERIAGISRHFADAPLFVDATGAGDPLAEDLRAGGLPVHPVVFNATRKRLLIDHLALAIEQERLTIYPHEQTVRELLAYEHKELPSGHDRTAAPPGGHDDCVMALALCHWGMSGGENAFILGSTLETCEPND